MASLPEIAINQITSPKTFSSNRVMLPIKRLEGKTIDPDETAHLDLQCLQIQLLLCLAFLEDNISVCTIQIWSEKDRIPAPNLCNTKVENVVR